MAVHAIIQKENGHLRFRTNDHQHTFRNALRISDRAFYTYYYRCCDEYK